MVFVFLFLTSLSMIICRSIHIAAMALFHSFLWLSSIPLCVYCCVCVPRLLYPFICQWTFRLLPCLGYYKWCFYKHCGAGIFWIYAQKWDYWDHMIVLFLVFYGTAILFSIMALPIYISTNSIKGRFPFLHTFFSICYL